MNQDTARLCPFCAMDEVGGCRETGGVNATEQPGCTEIRTQMMSSQDPHQDFQTQPLSAHQELKETKTFSTSPCLIELGPVMGGSCFSELK